MGEREREREREKIQSRMERKIDTIHNRQKKK